MIHCQGKELLGMITKVSECRFPYLYLTECLTHPGHTPETLYRSSCLDRPQCCSAEPVSAWSPSPPSLLRCLKPGSGCSGLASSARSHCDASWDSTMESLLNFIFILLKQNNHLIWCKIIFSQGLYVIYLINYVWKLPKITLSIWENTDVLQARKKCLWK